MEQMNAEHFIELHTDIKNDTRENREKLVENFIVIANHSNLECWNSPVEIYCMAHYILCNQDIPGPLLEFGCYKGCMSAKLSHVAKLVDKDYILFDSFNGLSRDITHTSFDGNRNISFKAGHFKCSIKETISNIQKFGCYEKCIIIDGKIEETLPKIDVNPSFALIDVEDVVTALFIIKSIWNKMSVKCLFTHESFIKEYFTKIIDKEWWNKNLNCDVPVLGSDVFGTEYGIPNSQYLNILSDNEKHIQKTFSYYE